MVLLQLITLSACANIVMVMYVDVKVGIMLHQGNIKKLAY